MGLNPYRTPPPDPEFRPDWVRAAFFTTLFLGVWQLFGTAGVVCGVLGYIVGFKVARP